MFSQQKAKEMLFERDVARAQDFTFEMWFSNTPRI